MNKDSVFSDPLRMIYLAPLLFLLHVFEEAPGFVGWFNNLVPEGINLPLFLSVNLMGMIITLILTFLTANTGERGVVITTTAWIAFVMFANGLFHLIATLATGFYAPGTITSVFLYLPYSIWFFYLVVKKIRVELPIVLTAIIIGSLPMFIHGYFILFKGIRIV